MTFKETASETLCTFIPFPHNWNMVTSKNETISVPLIDFNIHKRNFHIYYKPQTNPISPCCANRIQSLFSVLVMRLHSVLFLSGLFILTCYSYSLFATQRGKWVTFLYLYNYGTGHLYVPRSVTAILIRPYVLSILFPWKVHDEYFPVKKVPHLVLMSVADETAAHLPKALWNFWSQHPCRFRVSGTLILKFLLCRFFLCCWHFTA